MSSEEWKYTPSGIPLKIFYTPEDISYIDYQSALGNPGIYPFTRSIHPSGYRYYSWQNSMISGFGLPEEANQRQKYLHEKGVSGYSGRASINFAFDNPTQNGYDADHPLAKYEVGTGGVFVNSLKDMELLLEGFDLANLNIGLIIDTPGPIIFAIYIALSEINGVPRNKLRGIVCNSPWRRYYTGVALPFPPQHALRVATDCIKFGVRETPNFNTYSVNGYDIREGGATASQEVAFAISPAIEVANSCLKQGLKVDDFISNFNFFLSFQSDIFEEIAKIRAGRKVWAKIIKERYNARNDKSCWMKIHLQTGGSTLTLQEPLNNIARVAIQALGAVLAGVQSMSTNSFDEAISLPSDEAVRVAIKTQKIVEHETGVTNVVDPLGGSYYLEYLTQELEKEIWKYLDKIEVMGGYLDALENGYIERELANSALKHQREVEEEEKIIVGVNKYMEDEPLQRISFKCNPKVRDIQIERILKLKEERDNAKVNKILSNLREAATYGGELMPIYIEAALNYATLGEMMGVLREVFGTYKPKNLLAMI